MRRPLTPEERAARAAARENSCFHGGQSVLDFAATAPASRKPRRSVSRSRFDSSLLRAKELIEKGDWEKFRPKDLVALYAILHERVYGVLPLEVLPHYKDALLAAGSLVKREFKGSTPATIDFIQWTWKRAAARAGNSDFRIGWRYQFRSAALLTDYRVYLSRKGKIR